MATPWLLAKKAPPLKSLAKPGRETRNCCSATGSAIKAGPTKPASAARACTRSPSAMSMPLAAKDTTDICCSPVVRSMLARKRVDA